MVNQIRLFEDNKRLYAFIVALAATAIAVIQCRHYILLGHRELTAAGLLIDDAFFYSVTAKNFLDLGFFSLDGVMPTNGYQPLWMYLQVVLQWLFAPIDEIAILVSSSLVCYALFVFIFSWTMCVSSGSITGVLLGGLIFFWQPFFIETVIKGLETPLMLFLLSAVLSLLNSYGRAFATDGVTLKESLILGLFCALLFLARTDLAFAAMVIFTWVLWKEKTISTNVTAFCLMVSIFVVPYLFYNIVAHGGLMPISGRVKLFYLESMYPNVRAYLSSDEWQGPYFLFDYVLGMKVANLPLEIRLGLIAGGMWLVFFLVGFYRRVFSSITLLLGTTCFIHLLYMQFGHREIRPYTSYYFAPYVVFVALFLNDMGKLLILERRASNVVRKFWNFGVPSAALLFFIAANKYHEVRPSAYWEARLAAAEFVSTNDDIKSVAAFWPGVFAGYANKSITPADGIIGSDDYFERYVQPGREMDYLREQKIDYLIIFLDQPVTDYLGSQPPVIRTWPQIGLMRVWETRDSLQVVRSFGVDEDGRMGWHVLRILGS